MQSNTAEIKNQPVSFSSFSAENRTFDPSTIADGHYVGHDGIVVPKDFDEFYQRFPQHVRNYRGAAPGQQSGTEWAFGDVSLKALVLYCVAIVDYDFLTPIVVGFLQFALMFVKDARRTRLQKKILRTMLQSPKYKFGRHIDTLSHRIGESRETTVLLLVEIKARPDERGNLIWTLHPPT